MPAVLRLLRRAGFTTLDKNAAHYGLGLTLGNAEVRLDELVAAYAMLARGGELVAPRMRPRDRRRARAGASQDARPLGAHGVLDHRHPLRRRGARVRLRPRRQPRVPVHGRRQDRHVAGVSRQLGDRLHARRHGRRLGRQLRSHAARELVGRDRRRPDLSRRHARRRRARARLAADRRLHADRAADADVRRGDVCALSRADAERRLPARATEWVPAGSAIDDCTWHHASDQGLVTIWPAKYRHWARSEGLLRDVSAASARGTGVSRGAGG